MALSIDDLIGSMQHGFSAGDRGNELNEVRQSLLSSIGPQAMGPSGFGYGGGAGPSTQYQPQGHAQAQHAPTSSAAGAFNSGGAGGISNGLVAPSTSASGSMSFVAPNNSSMAAPLNATGSWRRHYQHPGGPSGNRSSANAFQSAVNGQVNGFGNGGGAQQQQHAPTPTTNGFRASHLANGHASAAARSAVQSGGAMAGSMSMSYEATEAMPNGVVDAASASASISPTGQVPGPSTSTSTSPPSRQFHNQQNQQHLSSHSPSSRAFMVGSFGSQASHSSFTSSSGESPSHGQPGYQHAGQAYPYGFAPAPANTPQQTPQDRVVVPSQIVPQQQQQYYEQHQQHSPPIEHGSSPAKHIGGFSPQS